MILIYFFIFLLLIGFSTFLIQKFRKDIRLKRRFYDFGDGTAIVFTILTMVFIFIGVNVFVDDPQFASTEDKIARGKETAQPWLVSQSYRSMLIKDSMNPDYMFGLIDAHYDEAQELGPDFWSFNEEESFIYKYTISFAQRDGQKEKDFGNLFTGVYYFYEGDMKLSKEYLDKVRDSSLKYLNNFRGRASYYFNESETGFEQLRTEIKNKGYIEGAYLNLALLYNHEKEYAQLFTLTYNPASREYVPYSIRSGVYIRSGDLGSYFHDLFSEVIFSGNRIGMAGALLILIAWMLYLLRVNVQRTSGILVAIGTVALSAALILPVWLLYDFYEFGLGFGMNGKVLNDLFYCIFGIGVIEEFVKIIPFLLLLFFTKRIKQPIDYIMFASLSALGFAFVENFMYFKEDHLNIMHSRALTASVTHMIDTSIVAYGLVLAKFKKNRSPVLYFCTFFLLAAVSHGFYDFWLLNDVVSDYSIVTFVYLLTSILIYASIINNSLNNAGDANANITLNTSRLSSHLAACLVGIFLFEFICLTWVYGPTISNRELIGSTLAGGYLILFISIRLSNIDIFPGEWYKIDWFVGFTPAQIIYGDKRPNYNLALGKKVFIQNFRTNSKLLKLLPVNGEIVRRVKIRGSTAWFLVRIDPPIAFHEFDHSFVLIRPKSPIELINPEYEIVAHFAGIRNLDALSGENQSDESIAFLDWVKVKET